MEEVPEQLRVQRFAELVRSGQVVLWWMNGTWALNDRNHAQRAPNERWWKMFGFRWNRAQQRWDGPPHLPPLVAVAQSWRAANAASASNETYEQRIRRLLAENRGSLIDGQNDVLYGFRTDGNLRYLIPLKMNGTTYANRVLWAALGMRFDLVLKRWYVNWGLSEIVMAWFNEQLEEIRARLASDRREHEDRVAREVEERRRADEERERLRLEREAREAEERQRLEEERQQRLAEALARMQQLSAQAQPNPTALSEADREEYDRLREYPGVPSDQYPPWKTLYDDVYAEIRRKIREGEALEPYEADVLMSVKQMAIDDAIEATRVEIEDMEVNGRLSRMPASSQARDQEMDPPWIAHVVEAVLELTDLLKERIMKHLQDNNLDIGTTKVPQDTHLTTPLGRLRVYVRNQAAKRAVVWNVYFKDDELRAIAHQALLDAGYQEPTQIREAKSLIIAMNAVAQHLRQTSPDLEARVRQWARQQRANALFFG